jgi:hypothetical protein
MAQSRFSLRSLLQLANSPFSPTTSAYFIHFPLLTPTRFLKNTAPYHHSAISDLVRWVLYFTFLVACYFHYCNCKTLVFRCYLIIITTLCFIQGEAEGSCHVDIKRPELSKIRKLFRSFVNLVPAFICNCGNLFLSCLLNQVLE